MSINCRLQHTPVKFNELICISCGKQNPDRFTRIEKDGTGSTSVGVLFARYVSKNISTGIMCRTCVGQLNNMHARAVSFKERAERTLSSLSSKRCSTSASCQQQESKKKIAAISLYSPCKPTSFKVSSSPSKIPILKTYMLAPVELLDHKVMNVKSSLHVSTNSVRRILPKHDNNNISDSDVSTTTAKRQLLFANAELQPKLNKISSVAIVTEQLPTMMYIQTGALSPSKIPKPVMKQKILPKPTSGYLPDGLSEKSELLPDATIVSNRLCLDGGKIASQLSKVVGIVINFL
jgi:hypothetical protein